MNASRGSALVSGMILALAVVIALIGGGYVLIHQGVGQPAPVFDQQPVATTGTTVIKETLSQAQTNTVATPDSVAPVEKPKPVQPTVKPATTPTQTQPVTADSAPQQSTAQTGAQPAPGTFSVKKVPSGFAMNMTEERKLLELSVTTGERPPEQKPLSLCMSIVDANTNAIVSETDCWPLKEFGTWTIMSSADFNLAPKNDRMDYWAPGHHPTKIKFELAQGNINDLSSETARTHAIILASDDTGTFDFFYPTGTN